MLSIRNQYNDIGFIVNDTSLVLTNPPQIDYIFAKRNTYMITNVLSTNYILNNKVDLSIKLRYHLDQVENIEFKKLDNEGYLIEDEYIGSHDVNYTTWTSDIAFNWWFAPGSQISLVWKNGIDNSTNSITPNWFENLEESFSLSQQNSLSLKLI